jgi:5'-3' exonuclease
MGIKHFFTWFKTSFSEYTYSIPKSKNVIYLNIDANIDNLMIDMNGIFHNSAQKVYEYGNYKQPPRLMKSKSEKKAENNVQKQIKLFKDVCAAVEHTIEIVKPNKRVILCVDGPAPLSKQNQQRQRRFRSAKESSGDCSFDTCSITPGTKFMDHLTKYIDWYIRKRMSEDKKWQNLEVIFSNEKVPGEGEHSCLSYTKNHGDPTETYCIYGLDADLIMLSLSTHLPNFYILRDDLYDPNNEYFLIDIGKVHDKLAELIRWESETFEYNPEYAINDFIFLCFMVGNDFLPHIPSIEIIEDGIELILKVYKKVGTSYGHITTKIDEKIKFVPSAMKIFLRTIGFYEKNNFENKLRKKASFFPDLLLEKCARREQTGKWTVDIEKYKTDYHQKCFPENYSMEKICHEYLEGMQWVLSYYTTGVPHWKWQYPHHYSPPASLLSDHIDSFQFVEYESSTPTTPFQQLLCVLPPKSAKLIPEPLCKLLTSEDSPLKKHCPDTFEVDLSGKRKEWEGTVLLPMVNFQLVKETYDNYISQVSPVDLKLNTLGKSFTYKFFDNYSTVFKSFYGDIIECKVKTQTIEL